MSRVPEYSAFVQEHYFDNKRYVKEDSIPQDADYDLNRVEGQVSV
jgi:hypothetical protein